MYLTFLDASLPIVLFLTIYLQSRNGSGSNYLCIQDSYLLLGDFLTGSSAQLRHTVILNLKYWITAQRQFQDSRACWSATSSQQRLVHFSLPAREDLQPSVERSCRRCAQFPYVSHSPPARPSDLAGRKRPSSVEENMGFVSQHSAVVQHRWLGSRMLMARLCQSLWPAGQHFPQGLQSPSESKPIIIIAS